jgi:thiol-disulfide isomerase/thioredoxin
MKALLLALALLFPLSLAARAEEIDINKPLELKFTAADGRKVDLEKLRGKVVLLDFWATWCPSCRQEVPNVVATYRKYHDEGFEIVGISLDEDKDRMLAFADRNGMVWPQYFDGQRWDNVIATRFGVQEIPLMMLIGKDGKFVRPGDDDLDTVIAKLLKSKA